MPDSGHTKDGGPAFPSGALDVAADRVESPVHDGMSLRDWFAGQALAGMNSRDTFDAGQATPEQRAKLAYLDADAMLLARKDQTNG